jgi:glycosidase
MRILVTSREKYQLDEKFFSTREGYVTFPKVYLARLFVDSINNKRDLVNFPELAVRTSEINGISLINEISHHIFDLYQQKEDVNIYEQLLEELDETFGTEAVNENLEEFINQFPPSSVYNKEVDVKAYLQDTSDGVSNREIAFQELIHTWLTNSNPSFSNHLELFNDDFLEKKTKYPELVLEIENKLKDLVGFGPENLSLLELLQTPIKEHPHSIKEQLEFIAKDWSAFLDQSYYYRLLYALDIFVEEEKMRGLGSGEAQVLSLEGLEERYTQDRDWMPNVVMIAKNTYVWLDQLSKKYQKSITRLDQIPDKELDQLAEWGFNALWLIGLWERSPASKIVKRWCGNPEAEASAYSLFDYVIANDLGGEDAYHKLNQMAKQRGIRLASDMVPNHTGIDSKWIRSNPDWYISLDYPPFPSYSYSGDSLSGDPNIGIFLEDHYFSRSDAAVTFKHVNYRTGKTRYIYHGNDGTSMPWNDTAQLNYLLPEVREAIIQTILHVARKFPIIRFDAAMTLTRKHFHRLWYPSPGSGGDIPSRAGLGLTHEEFVQKVPNEFWREVVDRINQEMPDTLLLAEAFWLLEGFFVRTLGMHRVYNSAFMNMMRDEDNAKYRSVIKTTLEYDPQILKRFVNFMNNPDEETAAKQFGKGDKYFGICLLLVTMPGLPMFGHGQVEGFTEKYGMEYRKSYWNEDIDTGLVDYHQRVIFPLQKKRYLYSGVENFLLYDLFTLEGYVDENVFCYSNGVGEESSLIVYNNKFSSTSGWIRTSTAYLDKENDVLIQKTIGEGLQLSNASNRFWIFRDQFSGLEYIRKSKEVYEKGLYVTLGGYQSMAILDSREVTDNEWSHYLLLHDFLDKRGVPNIEEARQELTFESLHRPFKEIYNLEEINALATNIRKKRKFDEYWKGRDDKFSDFYGQIILYSGNLTNLEKEAILRDLSNHLRFSLKSMKEMLEMDIGFSKPYGEYQLEDFLPKSLIEWGVVFAWILLNKIGITEEEESLYSISRARLDELLLGRVVEKQLSNFPTIKGDLDPKSSSSLVKILISHQNWFKEKPDINPLTIMRKMLSDPDIHDFLAINRYQEILWFNSERFLALVRSLLIIALISTISDNEDPFLLPKELQPILMTYQKWLEGYSSSEFQIEKFLNQLQLNQSNTVE